NNILQDLKPFQIIRVCRKFSRIIKFFYQLSQTKVIHISGFLLKEGEKVILNKIQKINSEEMQNYINMFIKEGVEIKIDKNKLDDFFNQYIDSLPKNKHYKWFQSRCRFVGDKITEKFLIYYLDNEKKLDREEIYITYKSLMQYKQIFVRINPEDFYIDPNKDDSHLWDSEPRFCIIETLFQMERNRKIKILEMKPESFYLECLNLEDLNITEEQKVKQYSNVEVVRNIKYDKKKGKFKIIENGKTIKEFPLGGYKELILKVLVNAKTPLTKNEIVKKSGKEEIKSFSTYISRLNKKPLKQLGLKIICENNKYSLFPIK
ncbi:MAG TPA: hypothetical protein P5150_04515, partial [Candidatus Ratteibacteria bacterium]|nr:hypothetical protein [Candidatus Ratteibacteria bacterium]